MTQIDMIVKGFALIGLFYILKSIALLVIRMDGYELKSHRHCYLHSAVAAVTLCLGWVYLKFDLVSPVRPLIEQHISDVVERPSVVSHDSFLLSEVPIAIDADFESSFDFEGVALFSEYYLFSDLEDPKYVHQPYSPLVFYENDTTEVVVIEVEEALKRVSRVSDAINDSSTNIREFYWSDVTRALTPSTRLNAEAGDIWSSVAVNVPAGDKNFIWNRQLPAIEADQEPPFDFAKSDAFEDLRYSISRNPNSWTASPGAVQRVVMPKVTPSTGNTDVPGAPHQQIKGLLQAAPGFYETIPEVRRFLKK
ncbi:MAG: hypothetical protein ACI9R3_002182 [Verrucomicrobiales bacterium]|jgi:hypothetical protein